MTPVKSIPFICAAFIVFTATALAHSKPRTMLPAADSSVPDAPSELSVYFTEGLEPKFSLLRLTDGKGTVLSKEGSKLDPSDDKHLTLALPKLRPGTYYVHWVAASKDGHKMDGDYKFAVK